jgi:hypothetical protein
MKARLERVASDYPWICFGIFVGALLIVCAVLYALPD